MFNCQSVVLRRMVNTEYDCLIAEVNRSIINAPLTTQKAPLFDNLRIEAILYLFTKVASLTNFKNKNFFPCLLTFHRNEEVNFISVKTTLGLVRTVHRAAIQGLMLIYALRPNSDLSQTSHCNIKGLSVCNIMRIEHMITQVKFSWYFNSFSPLLL